MKKRYIKVVEWNWKEAKPIVVFLIIVGFIIHYIALWIQNKQGVESGLAVIGGSILVWILTARIGAKVYWEED